MNLKTFLYGLFLVLPFFLASCGDDDLKNANSVSPNKVILSRDRTIGVDITYSDSARIKAKGYAPILDKVTPSNGSAYQEMIKGVNIDFYNQNGTIDGNLVCDYAIRRDNELKTEFRKNVVVKNSKGDTFSSQELIWDESKKIFYSNQMVDILSVNGDFTRAKDFKAPQDFSTYEMGPGSGEINSKGSL
ncbi:hypothetical protein H9N25_18665 [Pedobacter riviphilus]|uniref:LPS export ABC transporter periplasmic protein LptC n=1 Tax=Pedobacter riviphilus TaxID=2766984 RepID=A0ABX6TEI6_9SPHI|nr:hypothetical protein [Pedobacter riviphilus]QNR83928.1 hypothetical protein H9N25_18665 [Pedobacter riviphilus]